MEGWPSSLACAAMAAMVSQVSTKHSPLVVGFVGAAVALGWNSSKQYFFLTSSSTTKTEETPSSYAAEDQSHEVCMKFNSTEVLPSPLAVPEGNNARTATEDGSEVDKDCPNQMGCFSSCGSNLQGEVSIEPRANAQCPHHIANQLHCFPSCHTNLQGVSPEPLIVQNVQPLPSETDRTESKVPRQENEVQAEDGHEGEVIGFLQKKEVASPRVVLTSALEEMNNVTTTGSEVLEFVAIPTSVSTEEDFNELLDLTLLSQPLSMAVDFGGAVEGHTTMMPSLVDKFEGFEVGCAGLILETVALGMGIVKRRCEDFGNTHLIHENRAESMHEVVGDGAGEDVSNFLSSDVLLPEVLPETICENASVGVASDQQELADPDDKIFKALTKDVVKEGVRVATEQHVARLRAYDEYLADPKVSPHMKSQVMRAKSALQNFYNFEFQ